MSHEYPIGVALAGGASSRMGRDKAALRLADGKTLLEWTIERLRAVVSEVVVADGGRSSCPAGVVSIADGPGRGPAAGILGAAAARPGRALLVLACDLPQVPPAVLTALLEASGDWVVPRVAGAPRGGLEPLCALYRPPALEALEGLVAGGELALHRLAAASGLVIRSLDDRFLRIFGPPRELFLNLNTPEDLARLALHREELDG